MNTVYNRPQQNPVFSFQDLQAAVPSQQGKGSPSTSGGSQRPERGAADVFEATARSLVSLDGAVQNDSAASATSLGAVSAMPLTARTLGGADLSRIPPGTILGYGDRGESVRILQSALNALGYRLEADGVFGGQTESAVRDFQRNAGLSADGAAGPKTLQALARATQPQSPTPGTWTPAPTLDQVRTDSNTFLREGMQGEAVRQLQQLLNMPAEQQTGQFDAATKQATMAFQAANGLTPPPDKQGWVGKTTLEFLEKAKAPTPEPAPGPWTPAPALSAVRAGEAQLHEGMQGEAVLQLQKLLDLPAAKQTGQFDAGTKQAVMDYQRRTGLTPPPGLEGVVGKTTLEFLEKYPPSKGGTVDSLERAQRHFISQMGPSPSYSAGSPYGGSDCGPTSVAMVLSMLGLIEHPTPDKADDVIDLVRDTIVGYNSTQSRNMYTYELARGLEAFGAQTRNLGGNVVQAVNGALDRGNPVILGSYDMWPAWAEREWNKGNYLMYRPGGHFVVVMGKTEDGQYLLGDPLMKSGAIKVSAQQLSTFYGNNGFGILEASRPQAQA